VSSNLEFLDNQALGLWKADPQTAQEKEGERLPIRYLNWPTAYAFCIWDGGYLPSVLQWEYVAGSGEASAWYPWSLQEDGPSALAEGDPAEHAVCSLGVPLEVGSKTPGSRAWPHQDLAGNVAEWVLDTEGQRPVFCNGDCVVLDAQSATHHAKGGSYFTPNPKDAGGTGEFDIQASVLRNVEDFETDLGNVAAMGSPGMIPPGVSMFGVRCARTAVVP
jgi:formylglycine-generating enzyme required for sulfatase activity